MKILRLIWVLCCFLPLHDVSADSGFRDKVRILLINSDASLDKYRMVQEAFLERTPYPARKLDLGDRQWDTRQLEDFLYDEYPDITYCIGSKAYLTAKKYVGEKYIEFSSVLNWLRIPMTPNTYGVSNELHEDMQLMLFRYIFPDIGKIGMIYGRYTAQWFEKVRNKAKEMEMNITGQNISKTRGSFPAFDKLPKDIAAFWLISDPEITLDKKGLAGILKACDAKKIPVFSYHDAFARLGAVLILSVDDSTIGRQAAAIAMKLGSGRRPGQKVQPPAGSRIILNMKKVRLYGISYNEDALEAVNTIIE